MDTPLAMVGVVLGVLGLSFAAVGRSARMKLTVAFAAGTLLWSAVWLLYFVEVNQYGSGLATGLRNLFLVVLWLVPLLGAMALYWVLSRHTVK